jgi:hypothetical protein
MKIPFRPSLTPYEFSSIYKHHLRNFVLRGKLAKRFVPALEDWLGYLTQQYVMAVYGVDLLSEGDKKTMAVVWLRLLPVLGGAQMRTWFRRQSV